MQGQGSRSARSDGYNPDTSCERNLQSVQDGVALGAKISIAATVPQRSQGMSLLSIISLVSGGRGGISTDPAFQEFCP